LTAHFYTRVPGWFSFSGVYTEAVAAAPQAGAVFVEIGAWKGKSTSFMAVEIANSGKGVEFFAVDTWLGSDEAAHHNDPDVQAGRLYEVFLRNIKPVADYVKPIRAPSVEAAKLFEDGSVDFLLLDGDHTLEGVRADLAAWLPKMKPGATLAGDDWNWSGVHTAVRERFAEDRIEVLGDGKGRHWRVRL
jgi:cephalosporin hydroxylase